MFGGEIELATYRSAPVSSSLDSSPASSKALVEGARQVTFLEWSRAGQSPVAFKALSKPSSLSSSAVTVRTVTEQGLGGRRTLRSIVSENAPMCRFRLTRAYLLTTWKVLAPLGPHLPSTAVILTSWARPDRRFTSSPLICCRFSFLSLWSTLVANTT